MYKSLLEMIKSQVATMHFKMVRQSRYADWPIKFYLVHFQHCGLIDLVTEMTMV